MLGLFNRRKRFREPQIRITQSTGLSQDYFGISVALSADGSTAIVGAYLDNVGPNGDQGTATIFTRSGASWTEQQTITQSGGAADDYFGYSVALSGDGNTAIVGAYADDVGANSSQGSATIFTRSGSLWTQQQTITQSGGAAFDYFGTSVALSSDGNTAVVGAPKTNHSGYTNIGSAVVFTRSGSTWTQLTVLTPVGYGDNNTEFGTAVALSGDGLRIAVGVPYLLTDWGGCYMFEVSGGSWFPVITIIGTAGSLKGSSVALSRDGNTAIIGAIYGGINYAGYADVHVYNGGWAGVPTATLTYSAPASYDNLGYRVAVSNNGRIAIVTMFNAATNNGRAIVYTLSGSVWTQQQTITQTSNIANNAYFAVSVALSDNGNIAIIGAIGDAIGGNTNQGSAIIMSRR